MNWVICALSKKKYVFRIIPTAMKRMSEGTPKLEENLAKRTPIKRRSARRNETFSIEKSI
jgi:hypothetical protein